MNFKKTLLATGLLSAYLISPLTAQANVFTEALEAGEPNLDIRFRHESADVDDGTNDKGEAFTVRTRLGFKTGDIGIASFFVEMEDVRVIGGEDEYGTQTDGFDTIADPESTELNQGYLSLKPHETTTITIGRQRLIIDNARFVGNVGWRQNEQTFDAFTLKYTQDAISLTASYIDRVNGITPKFDANTSHALLNFGYAFDAGKLSLYSYNLEDDNSEKTYDTVGLRFSGKSQVSDDLTMLYTLEFASQDYEDPLTDTDQSADYSNIELGFGFSGVKLFLGQELLSSDDGDYGFQTPLATKHAFNGWADSFLVTPDDGLEDNYIKLVSTFSGIKLIAIAHEYAGDESGEDIGSEFDLLLVKKFGKHYTVGAKYASFSADEDYGKTDADKLWIWAELKF